jgi:RNA polymerase sigma factor (TIGR02999 family)
VTGDGDITHLLNALASGKAEAADALWPMVYGELHRLADRYFRGEPANHTLQPTALVNEAFIRLARSGPEDWESRAQFYAVAACAMRHVLVDHARRRKSAKRGGKQRPLRLDGQIDAGDTRELEQLLDLDDALSRLADTDKRLVQLVELRYFAGLTFDEAARVLGVAPITAKRMWRLAKGWLFREMARGEAK